MGNATSYFYTTADGVEVPLSSVDPAQLSELSGSKLTHRPTAELTEAPAYTPSPEGLKFAQAICNPANPVSPTNNSTIILDLCNENAFPCPMCPDDAKVSITVETLSAHVAIHKRQDKIEPVVESEESSSSSSDDAQPAAVDPLQQSINGENAEAVATVYATRESQREYDFMGGLSEEAAIARAIAESLKENTTVAEN